MKVEIHTDGTPENTQVINVRTGEEVKNLEVVELKEYVHVDGYSIDDHIATRESLLNLGNIFHSVRRENV